MLTSDYGVVNILLTLDRRERSFEETSVILYAARALATTSLLIQLQAMKVIGGNLFTRRDIPEGVEKEPSAAYNHITIRIA